jgi:four helix bundle protein
MAKSRDLRVRSFEFTVSIVRLCRTELTGDSISRRLAFQLVDAVGSVGANLEESGAGQTKPDFIAKQFIAQRGERVQILVASDRRGLSADGTKTETVHSGIQ